jgi:hypothetical protein
MFSNLPYSQGLSYSLLVARDQVSHPYKIVSIIAVLCAMTFGYLEQKAKILK